MIGPVNEHVELEHGGDLNIVRFGDGEIRLSYERAGVRFSVPLTIEDVREAKRAFSAVSIADHVAWVTDS